MSLWTSAHSSLLETFASVFPIPPAPANDDACRDWTRKAAEQFAFSFPMEPWGHKSAGNGRPPSTDVIATSSPFEGYDLINQQGAPSQSLNNRPTAIPLPGQVFIPVSPKNHIGQIVDPQPPPTDLEARVAKLEAWARAFR
jgi:hypothetical protein